MSGVWVRNTRVMNRLRTIRSPDEAAAKSQDGRICIPDGASAKSRIQPRSANDRVRMGNSIAGFRFARSGLQICSQLASTALAKLDKSLIGKSVELAGFRISFDLPVEARSEEHTSELQSP